MLKRLQLLLVGLLLLLQYQLWLGDNNRFETWRMQRDLAEHQARLAEKVARNDQLRAEVRELKQGLGAHEELARTELGYIREDEIFFRVIE
ncbi:MAG: septum formation initiator family protein [Immundisolibacteraceae bacterium]|jgi:cell division protein FtsB|nr:septum formation initiator family protein [Immundisolibacteraceae bacterium]